MKNVITINGVDLLDEVFEWENAETGERWWLNVTKLWEFVFDNIKDTTKVQFFHDDIANLADLLLRTRDIEEWRVERLAEPWLSLPMLAVEVEKEHTVTVDGHHRFVRWHRRGDKTFKIVRVEKGHWERFKVDGMDDLEKLFNKKEEQ